MHLVDLFLTLASTSHFSPCNRLSPMQLRHLHSHVAPHCHVNFNTVTPSHTVTSPSHIHFSSPNLFVFTTAIFFPTYNHISYMQSRLPLNTSLCIPACEPVSPSPAHSRNFHTQLFTLASVRQFRGNADLR